LGNFVGPTIAGFAVDFVGFRDTTLIFFCLYVVMLVVDTIEAINMVMGERRLAMYDQLD
jgi:hypothetical protein